ncbi:aminopeptidase [Pedobacter sp. BAL39]|uniref:M28 family metallopeptidase n=1 Tax=Pedobacter sp. BAL39 TaxID=391596 RepID=UPI0001559F2A|nr:M28 family peptidase [Pedobacter sp. BAL39]EDM36435.1 aminopeptidase [Pedobacter sp. BAL39]
MKKYLLILLIAAAQPVLAQDMTYARKMIDTLTSPTLWGRGYTNEGMAKAALLISNEFKASGLQPLSGDSFMQELSYPVNTFPGKMSLKINGKALQAGKDFIVMPESQGREGYMKLMQRDSTTFINSTQRVIVRTKGKLTWSVAPEQADYTGIEIRTGAIEGPPKDMELHVENKLLPAFKADNICGMVRGKSKPDSIIFITAHYDHLGGMGDGTYFPGANDNASGVSFLLNLAKYYAKHPQPYTIAFICFAGEEIGLMGSKYFTENPLTDLKNIRFLINVDMVGTGGTGITVVNATLHSKEFELLNEINNKHHYLVKINPRGKAANSDHYFFTESGVPAFFMYTQGGISAYHDVDDRATTLPLTAYEQLFKLFVAFNSQLMKPAAR